MSDNQEQSQLLTGAQSTQKKSEVDYGLKWAKKITSSISGGDTNSYYRNRNSRFRKNRNAANGNVNMTKYMDLLELNGKTNFVNLNPASIKIINRITSGLVGRWMGRTEKIAVKAIDNLSQTQKQQEYAEVEYMMLEQQRMAQLQQQSGVQMIPQGQFIPSDKDELILWQSQFQRISEEILYELGVNDILRSNGWFDTLKERALQDSCQVGFVGTCTWMDEFGIIHIDPVKPENAIYSFSDYNDFRDSTWRGEIKGMKISELRKKYGKEFGGKLSEEEIFEYASTAKEFQVTDKLTWDSTWTATIARPYDEYNVDVVFFEVRLLDSDPVTIVTTKQNKSTLLKKGRSEKPAPNEEVIIDKNWNIYRGAYVRTATDKMLEWGVKSNMIRPQDPKELGDAEFSYSFFMYQNYEMRNVAVPEKIEEPTDQMIVTRLKIQQVIMKMRPIGAAYNVDAMQEIDIGLATGVSKPHELQKIYDQTGNMYYRGRDAEGNPLGVPIQELQNSGFLGQMEGLIKMYAFHYQVLKDELGEDPNLITQAIQPRVTQGNVQTSQREGENSTDYMYDAFLNVMEQSARKVACLLKDSVTYGSAAYSELLQKDQVDKRVFSTDIQMLPDEMDIQRIEAMMNESIRANGEMLQFLDPFQLMRVAKEDAKLAEAIFRNAQKKFILYQQQQAQQNAQMNAQAQQDSLQMKAQADYQHMQTELQLKGAMADAQNRKALELAIVNGAFAIAAKGLTIPTELSPAVTEVINNVVLPMFAQNIQNTQALGSAIQQAQGANGQQQSQMGQPQMQDDQQGQDQQMQPSQQPQPQAA